MQEGMQIQAPHGYIFITPKGEDGVVLLRADKIEACFVVPEGGAILNLDGDTKVDFVPMIVGILGGKRFNFKVEETIDIMLSQIDKATREICGINSLDSSLPILYDPKEPVN